MILHTIIPQHLAQHLPAEINGKELQALLKVPDLRHAMLSEVSSSYIRRLAKTAAVDVLVKDQGHLCSLERAVSPRGYQPLERLEAQLAWHATRVSELAADRALVAKITTRADQKMAHADPTLATTLADTAPTHALDEDGALVTIPGLNLVPPSNPNPWADLMPSTTQEA
jgi:hypothetical protein